MLRREEWLKDDLKRNCADDVLMLTSWEIFKGHDGVPKLAAKLKNEAPDGVFDYELTLWQPLPMPERALASNVVNLMDALKKSLGSEKAAKTAKPKRKASK